MSVKLSVIIPIHNTEKYLNECLKSIQAQKIEDIEVICVDDGSTDNSYSIMNKFARNDLRFKIIKTDGKGPGFARNKGTDVALGEYVAFVDSDDYIHPEMLQAMYDVAIQDSVDIVMCTIKRFSQVSKKEEFPPCRYDIFIPRKLDNVCFDWTAISKSLFDLRFASVNKIYKKNFLIEHGIKFSEGIFYEDLVFTFKSLLLADKMRFIREAYYFNRKDRAGATTSLQGNRVFGALTAIGQLEEFLDTNPKYSVIREQFDAFKFKKLVRYLHKNDANHVEQFYQYIKEHVQTVNLQLNSYLSPKDKRRARIINDLNCLEYLLLTHWEAKNTIERLKRKVRFVERRNSNSSVLKKVFKRAKGLFPKSIKVIKTRILKDKRSVSRDKPVSIRKKEDSCGFLRPPHVNSHNEQLLTKLRAKVKNEKPIRIGFVVNEAAKWNCDSLFEKILETECFEVRIYLCINPRKGYNREDRRRVYLAERDFFLRIDKNLIDMYDWVDDFIKPIEDVDADILFFQQPWGMKDFPLRMLGRALSTYMHYGFVVIANHDMQYKIDTFHPYLWKYFSQTEAHKLLHLEHDPHAHDKIVVTGYPKLDTYLNKKSKKHKNVPNKKTIVYAPHHSMTNGSLRMATFGWMHRIMLKLAKENTQFQWVYKPHPKLKHSIGKSKFMTRQEYAEYEMEWSKLPNATVFDRGGYFEIFKTSDVMITDCGSFLAEYLPTGNPIIWLKSEHSVGLNKVGLSLEKAFYKATNLEEFITIFDEVVVAGIDPLISQRREAISKLFPYPGKSAAEVIVSYLRSQLVE